MRKALFFFLSLIHIYFLNAEEIDFDRQIRPILSDKCYFCHGPDKADIKGDLQLHSFEAATSDRDGAGAAIVPGDAEASYLWERINTDDEDDIMPPKKRHMPVTDEEKALIKAWINQGAKYEDLWSFKPLPNKVKVPQIQSNFIQNDIDPFIQTQLAKEGLTPNKETDPETLVRRLYLSLTGLQPTIDEVDTYLNDKDPKAYENLVDKLLKTKDFAEHLAVDWMDLARYADSYGYQVDRGRDVKAWRTWLVNALKNNMPYDEFITQQLAGDLMPNSDDQMKLATTFNRLHMQKVEGGSTPEEFRTEYVFDRTQTAGTAFLGLTFDCTRCHDHKYDPITQEDYFKTFALFNNIDEAGLYSFFTKSVPTPTLRLMNEKQKRELHALENKVSSSHKLLLELEKSEQSAYQSWLKTAQPKPIIVQGKKADFYKTDLGFKDMLQEQHLNHKKLKDKNTNYQSNIFNELNGDTALKLADFPLNRGNPLTYLMSVYTDTEHERAIIAHQSKAYTDAASQGLEILIENGHITFALVHFSPGNEIRIQTKSKLPIKKWVDLTVSYDGSAKASGLNIYFDGKAMPSIVIKDRLNLEINYGKEQYPLAVGARMRDRGFKDSKIRKFEVYDRELNPQEISIISGTQLNQNQTSLQTYLNNNSADYKKALAELVQSRKALFQFENKIKHIMTMEEMAKPRQTYVLNRGLYSDPNYNHPVEPGVPEIIFPFGETYPKNRFGFAKWLTHPNHPLTSRVAVNRYWQKLFSRGIVKTSNDFGFQGDLPTHPDLLNYLSRFFIQSGWDIQKLCKLMVMSHTFRQDSNPSPTALNKDPENKFLSRGPSYHMTAEMLMDNAHWVSGKKSKSMYTTWSRNNPKPEMLIFGTPRRQICEVSREKTSTPLQSLVLLNSPHYNGAALQLAGQFIKQANPNNTSELIAKLFRQATARTIKADELEVLSSFYEAELKASDQKTAWNQLASLVLNTDSFYMVR